MRTQFFCDGACKSWLHRRCAGLSSTAFKEVADSHKPFLCPYCRFSAQDNLIALLKTSIDTSKSEISSFKEQIPTSATRPASSNENSTKNIEGNIPTATRDIDQVSSNKPRGRGPYTQMNGTDRSNDPNRKYHLVIYGLNEHDKGTPHHTRLTRDSNSALEIMSALNPSVSEQSICDCIRLGHYSANNRRPLLVKLTWACDVATILSHRANLSQFPNITIKPQMSAEERRVESVLLKERRSLILNGTSRKLIKIRGNRLFVSNRPSGQVINEKFVPISQDHSTQPNTAASPSSTNPNLNHDNSTSPSTSADTPNANSNSISN